MTLFSSNLFRLGFAALLMGVVAGCSTAGPAAPATVKVGGTITYGGGAWPHPATLTFVPVAGADGGELHTGTAEVKTDGTFAATTFAPGDGLTPGTYQVAVHCKEPDTEQGPGEKDFAPAKFQSADTSGLEVTVPKGGAEQKVTWDVPKS